MNDESSGSVMNQAVVREESFDKKQAKIKNKKVQIKVRLWKKGYREKNQ